MATRTIPRAEPRIRLTRERVLRAAITHAAMEQQGDACGGCHGKAAFGFQDCTMCHAQ